MNSAEFRAGSVLDITLFVEAVLSDPSAVGIFGQPSFEQARRAHGAEQLSLAESLGYYAPTFLGGGRVGLRQPPYPSQHELSRGHCQRGAAVGRPPG